MELFLPATRVVFLFAHERISRISEAGFARERETDMLRNALWKDDFCREEEILFVPWMLVDFFDFFD